MTVYNIVLIVIAVLASVVKNALKAFALLGATFAIAAVIAYIGLPPVGVLAAIGFYAGVLSLVYGIAIIAYHGARIKFCVVLEYRLHSNARILEDAAAVCVDFPGMSLKSNLQAWAILETRGADQAKLQYK